MSSVIVVLALALLMFVAYRGFSVILFAPICALLAVLLTDPSLVAPVFSGVFMDKMVGFIKSYLPVFLLGAVFGKVIELSGFARSIVTAAIGLVGREPQHPVDRARLRAPHLRRRVAVRRGVRGLSVRRGDVPPGRHPEAPHPRHHRARRVHLHDGCAARHAADPEHHPHDLLQDQHLGRAVAGHDRRAVHPGRPASRTSSGGAGRPRRRAKAMAPNLVNEPEAIPDEQLPNPWLALAPLVIVGVMNKVFTLLIPRLYGTTHTAALPGLAHPVVTRCPRWRRSGRWKARCCSASSTVVAFAFGALKERFAEGSKAAVAGALLAAINTASEYGFGGVIAALPGFLVVANGLKAIPGVLVNEAVTVTALAGVTGSASGRHEHRARHHGGPLHRGGHTPRASRSRSCTASPPWRAAAWTRCRTTARSSRCSPSRA